MRILLVEPWFHGSHRQWAEGYREAGKSEEEAAALRKVLELLPDSGYDEAFKKQLADRARERLAELDAGEAEAR